MSAAVQIPDLAVLLLAYGRERWLVVHRRGALRLLMHAVACDAESIWRDAVRRAQQMSEQLEGCPGGSVSLRVDLSHAFSGPKVHEFLCDRLLSDPKGMLHAFSECLGAEQMAVPA